MKVKELREEIKRLKGIGYESSVKLNSKENVLRWEVQKLQGLEFRDRLVGKGLSKVIFVGEDEEGTEPRVIDLSEKRVRVLEIPEVRRAIIRALEDSDGFISYCVGQSLFRGYAKFQ